MLYMYVCFLQGPSSHLSRITSPSAQKRLSVSTFIANYLEWTYRCLRYSIDWSIDIGLA